jgi:hypothetical protein
MQIAKLVKTALDETRMLVLGAQILLGFELSGIFRDGFESLPMHARYLDGIALLLMIIARAGVAVWPPTVLVHDLGEWNAAHRPEARADNRLAGGEAVGGKRNRMRLRYFPSEA